MSSPIVVIVHTKASSMSARAEVRGSDNQIHRHVSQDPAISLLTMSYLTDAGRHKCSGGECQEQSTRSLEICCLPP